MILDLHNLPSPIDPELLFGRAGPLEIEIGVGKGRFLREYAAANPHVNLLGIEKSRKWLFHARDRIEKAGVPNVRLVQCYVEGFLERFIRDASVTRFHVYFPDPWPKRRHGKRRLFRPAFLEAVRRTLVPGGEIAIATDYADYFASIEEVFIGFRARGLALERTERGPFVTNFQAKYEREGRPIWFALARKEAAGPPPRRPTAASAPSAAP